MIGAVIGGVCTVAPLFNSGSADGLYQRYDVQVGFATLVAIALGGVAWWQRTALGATTVNRRTVGAAILVFAAQGALAAACWMLGIPSTSMQVLMILLWAVVAAQVAIQVDRRFTATALGYLIAFFLAARWPAHRPLFASAANLALLVTMMQMWRTQGARPAQR